MYDDAELDYKAVISSIDIIKQNEAVIAAIKKLNQMILENHLKTCVTQAIKGRDKKEQKKKIKELLEIFKNSKSK